MKAGFRALLVCALVGLFAAVAVGPAAAQEEGTGDAAASKRDRCFQGSRDDLGASYVYKITARNLNCDRAKNLVEQFHKCRHQNGGWNGKCNGFKGFSCSQKKLDSSNTLLQAKGKCTKGSQRFANVFGELRR